MARRIAGTTEADWLHAEQLGDSILCRTLGHPWRPVTADKSPLARSNDVKPKYLFCPRCELHRKVVTNRYFERTNTYHRDKDSNYGRPGQGRVTAAVNSVFWSVLDRYLGGA